MQENKQFNAVQADLLQLAGLLTEDHWCKGPAAVDARGRPVDALEGDAVRWCLYGGIAKITGARFVGSTVRSRAMYVALNNMKPPHQPSAAHVNDDPHTTHRDVQDFIMRAVECAAT